MPPIKLIYFQESTGEVPVRDWLSILKRRNPRAAAKCVAVILRLQAEGHLLYRPHADQLDDKIYELRTHLGHVNYRILFFFAGTAVAVLAHAITKTDVVPSSAIRLATRRREEFLSDPQKHSWHQPVSEE